MNSSKLSLIEINLRSDSEISYQKTNNSFSSVKRKLQSDDFFASSDGLAVMLIIYIFMFAYCVPILRFIYNKYISKYVEAAAIKAKELSQRITDRLSDAGRKVSDRMTTRTSLPGKTSISKTSISKTSIQT